MYWQKFFIFYHGHKPPDSKDFAKNGMSLKLKMDRLMNGITQIIQDKDYFLPITLAFCNTV